MATSKKPRAVEHRQGHNDNEHPSSGTFVPNKRQNPSGANARAGEISKPNVERWHKAVDRREQPKAGGIMGVLGISGMRPRGQSESKLHYYLSGIEGNKKAVAKQKSRYDKKTGFGG